MKILCYLGEESTARFALMRAAALLGLDSTVVLTEKQLIHLAESHCKKLDPSSLLIVTSDANDRLVRELFARTPKARLLLLTSRNISEVPAFMSNSSQFDGFYISTSLNCGPEFFLNFFSQQMHPRPFELKELLRPHRKSLSLILQDNEYQQEVKQKVGDFYLWCLGDETDPLLQKIRDRLLEVLNELLTNVENHCLVFGKERNTPTEIEISFDGVHIATRLKDPFGLLSRAKILKSLTDVSSTQSNPSKQKGFTLLFSRSQRVIFNIIPGRSTEIIFFNRLSLRGEHSDRTPLGIEMREWAES